MKNCFFMPLYNLCAETADMILNWYACRIMGLAEHIPEETTSSSFYRELNPKYLKEIYIKAQNELKELQTAIDKNEVTAFDGKDNTGG